ncbi:MAG: thioredoxin-dependent thiol peroxidase [Bacteroidota bacterium]
MTNLKEGDKAPEFEGINQKGEKISLKVLTGKKVILYFYPKDDTPGCTAEACNLGENYSDLTNRGFEVIGVSPDNEKSHQKFIDKYSLPFDLVADTEHEIANNYGVWGEKNNYGKKYFGIHRTTFIIGEDGTIEKIFTKVDTKNHTNQILNELKDS